MPNIDLVAIAKIAFRFIFFGSLVTSFIAFTNYLLGFVPTVNVGGCLGRWIDSLGLITAIRITLSIVVYGAIFKFSLGLFSKSLD